MNIHVKSDLLTSYAEKFWKSPYSNKGGKNLGD